MKSNTTPSTNAYATLALAPLDANAAVTSESLEVLRSQLNQRSAEARAAAEIGRLQLEKEMAGKVEKAESALAEHLEKAEAWDVRQPVVEKILLEHLAGVFGGKIKGKGKSAYADLLAAFKSLTGRDSVATVVFQPVGIRKDEGLDIQLFREVTREKWNSLAKEREMYVAVKIPAIRVVADPTVDNTRALTRIDGVLMSQVDHVMQLINTPAELVAKLNEWNQFDTTTDELRAAVTAAKAEQKAALSKMDQVQVHLSASVLGSTESGRVMLESVMSAVNTIAAGGAAPALLPASAAAAQ